MSIIVTNLYMFRRPRCGAVTVFLAYL
jgi:hypothetical protein